MPGFTLDDEDFMPLPSDVFLASYAGFWIASDPSNSTQQVTELLATVSSAELASGVLGQLVQVFQSNPGVENVRDLGAQGVGNEDRAVYWTRTMMGVTREFYVDFFRRGQVIVGIEGLSPVGRGSIAFPVSLAKIVDGRLGTGIAPGTSAVPAAAAGSTPELAGADGVVRDLMRRAGIHGFVDAAAR
jgi:hypothetical protein